MAETCSSSRDPVIASRRRRCPNCDATMHLARVARGSSNFDIRAFDCRRCDHTHIVTAATDLVSDNRSLHAKAIDALEEAQAMSPGARRNDSLKKAGRLRRIADNQGVISAKRDQPRK